jgi:hypothetical protein
VSGVPRARHQPSTNPGRRMGDASRGQMTASAAISSVHMMVPHD